MPHRPEDVLKDAAKDVRYEVQRMLEAATLYPVTPEANGKKLLIEALLLHFRNLLDFFYTDSKNPDDIKASHFFPDPSQWRPTTPDWYLEYRNRCNKLLAHLTYSRVEYKCKNEMNWVLNDKLSVLKQTWKLFLTMLPAERQRWFDVS